MVAHQPVATMPHLDSSLLEIPIQDDLAKHPQVESRCLVHPRTPPFPQATVFEGSRLWGPVDWKNEFRLNLNEVSRIGQAKLAFGKI